MNGPRGGAGLTSWRLGVSRNRRRPTRIAEARWDLLLICLAVMLLTYVWRFQSIFSPVAVLQVTAVATLGAYALFVTDRDPRRTINRLNQPVLLLMLAIFALMLLSVPGSLWPGASVRFMRDHTKTLAFALLLAASLRAFVDVERLAAVHILGAIVYSAMVLFGAEVGPGDRAAGIGGYDSNDYSMLLVCTIPLGLYFLATSGSLRRRMLAGLAVMAMTLAIIKGGSRGGFVGLVIIFIYMLFAYSALPKKVRVGAVVLGLFCLTLVANETYWARMRTLVNPKEDYNWSGQAYHGRIEIWKRGVGYMLQRPLTGVGVGQFARAEGRLAPRAQRPGYIAGWKWYKPHNSFVEIGAEIGVAGLVLFLGLLWAAARALGRLSRSPPGSSSRGTPQTAMAQALSASLLGYAVVGFFISQAYAYYLYALLGLIAGVVKISMYAPGRRRMPRRRVATASMVALPAGDSRARRRLLRSSSR